MSTDICAWLQSWLWVSFFINLIWVKNSQADIIIRKLTKASILSHLLL